MFESNISVLPGPHALPVEGSIVSFGHDLRQEREQRGISLEEIAATTRVSTRFLRALESDTYADLPGGIFNRSMVRGYCTHLGLDPAPWLEHFRTQHVAEPAERDWAHSPKTFAAPAPPPAHRPSGGGASLCSLPFCWPAPGPHGTSSSSAAYSTHNRTATS